MTAIDTTDLHSDAVVTHRRWPPFLAVVYLAAILFPVMANVGPILLTSMRAFGLVMIVPLTIMLLMGRAGRLNAVDFFMALHLIWATVALAINNPEQVVQQAGAVGIELSGGYVAGRVLIRDRAQFMGLMRLLVRIVVLIFPFAIYEAMTGRSILLDALSALPGLMAPADLPIGQRLGLNRVQFTFVHPIHFGLFCSVAVPLCIVGLNGVVSDARRWIIGGIVCITGFLALSSGALIAIAGQVGLIIWAMIFAQIKERWWILVGLAALAYVLIDILSNRTPVHVFLSYATFSSHTAYWRLLIFEHGMNNVWANPLFGIGLNDWIRPRWMYSGSMDNFWLVMTVRYGIPGFLLLAAAYLLGLFRIMFRDLSADPLLNQMRTAWVFVFVGLTFTLCTVHIWNNLYSFVFFMFAAGLWMHDAPIKGDGGEEETSLDQAVRNRRHGPERGAYTRFPGNRPAAGISPRIVRA